MKCSKCSSTENLTDHHVHPRKWFGGGRGNKYTVKLCTTCHMRLERHILAVEAFVHDKPFGPRYRLGKEDYEKILRNFLGKSEVIYLEAS